jgi:hypothetical protein
VPKPGSVPSLLELKALLPELDNGKLHTVMHRLANLPEEELAAELARLKKQKEAREAQVGVVRRSSGRSTGNPPQTVKRRLGKRVFTGVWDPRREH